MNVAGSNGTAVFGGDEGPALSALLSALNGVGLTSTGVITTFSGLASLLLRTPGGVAISMSGDIIVANTGHHTVTKARS